MTAATTAAVTGLPSGLEPVELLKPLARRNAYGGIGGAGLALVPRDPLIGLCFWAPGENNHYKNGAAYRLQNPVELVQGGSDQVIASVDLCPVQAGRR
ncbi:hypothetical protein V1J52_11810 [Streptomyces sp. TRM 70351]|uniref:hypothetical protein n=1 Tax=Streptomyces sp. TRM 70351 TaxID=3116552 RepID=UPI002E7C036D|nr:hypothetical protein [Streptomyces sp. TRM 70351]MEE1928855.1 hypothetical protein [Streptomyces sp. TRM 70351]